MKKILIIIIIIFFYIFFSFIKIDNINEERTISVEVRINNNSSLYTLPFGSTFNDLLQIITISEDDDISIYSLNQTLYNNQIISIPNKSNLLISINSASIEELMTLPGIGIKTANLIIEYRNKNGSFKELTELKMVKGIGDKTFEKIRKFISL